MLKADDYKEYMTGLRGQFQTSKYLLRNWVHYERNFSSLEEAELNNARRLYTGLGHLTEEERMFLADKYRSALKKDRGHAQRYRLDKKLAKEHGMKKLDYAELRKGIELKLSHYLKQEEGV